MNAVTVTQGPRYTISGDFHYCVIEAESSTLGETTIAVAYSTSPGAEPGDEWREQYEAVLWLLPDDTAPLDPLTVALRLLARWYEPTGGAVPCLTCGQNDCAGGCYPEHEPIKAKPADIKITQTADGQSCLACWNGITVCYACGEMARCACGGCNNANCDDYMSHR